MQLGHYFDFISPYSYFSWQLLKKFKALQSQQSPHSPSISLHPVLLGKILQHWGIIGPAAVTPKRNYLFKNCLRYAARNGIPFTTPARLPFNSLLALRLSTAAAAGNLQWEVMDALWRWGWELGGDLEDPQQLLQALMPLRQLGVQMDVEVKVEEIWERASSSAARTELRGNIEQAIGQGVFGVPTFVVDGEIFWGKDSFEDLQQYLTGSDPLPQAQFAQFLEKHRDTFIN